MIYKEVVRALLWRLDVKTAKNEHCYSITEDEIQKWITVPLSRKLQWLEEANQFFWKFQSPKAHEIMEKHRHGEI